MLVDSISLVSRLMGQEVVADMDKLMLLSAINHHTVDINGSIKDNIDLLDRDELTKEDLKTIVNIIKNSDGVLLEKPIYMWILEKKDLRDSLSSQYAKGYLKEETLLNILEYLLHVNELDEETLKPIIFFLTNLISSNRPRNYKMFQESEILASFVNKYDNCVYQNAAVHGEDFDFKFKVKIFIFKLFAGGYVNFAYPKIAGEEDKNGFSAIFTPLLMHRNYGHARLLINSKTLNTTNYDDFAFVILKCFKDLYRFIPTAEEREKDLKFISEGLDRTALFLSKDKVHELKEEVLKIINDEKKLTLGQ